MHFVEFIVFICRVVKEHYDGTPYEGELLYLKLNALLPTFLREFYLEPAFLFPEKFAYDIA